MSSSAAERPLTAAAVSVAIPVKDGGPLLRRLLASLERQTPGEVLVIDSGSTDGSQDAARSYGAELIEIAPESFGHGRTRNLATAETSGELLCFLTQDAVPEPGWLTAYLDVFARPERIGAAYGPHLPWSDTSPMIARELTEFFASMSANGAPELQTGDGLAFLSNVNACYRRACLEEIGFADVAYSEDQAFGRAMLAAGWVKAYVPEAAVRHAHDYGLVEFARRYFDEARGLADTTGHRGPARPAAVARAVRDGYAADAHWIDRHNESALERGRWKARALIHHISRRGAEALGSRHERLPDAAQRVLSLERRGSASPGEAPTTRAVPAQGAPGYMEVAEVSRSGVAPLLAPRTGRSSRDRLHLAWVVPPWARGSGGHNTIFRMVRRMEKRGHTCTIWVHDASTRKLGGRYPSVLRQEIRNWFELVNAPVFVGFDDWHGADVAVATGWDTAHRTALLGDCAARAYFVQDHEPEFYATSAEGIWAEQTYGLGLFPICASPWLRDLIAERHGIEGTAFRLGVDPAIYHPRAGRRRDDTVICYSRDATERRGVPLAVLALETLRLRRPDVRVVMFGQSTPLRMSFGHESLGIATAGELAVQYSQATVGVCLSLTNYSLIPQEMMACGLPCVDVAGGSSESVFGADGPAELCAPDPVALANGIESLMTDHARWARRSEAGLAFVADADWDRAADQVEDGLRRALAMRENGG